MKLIDQAEANLMVVKMHKEVMQLQLAIAKQDTQVVSEALRGLFAELAEQREIMRPTKPEETNDNAAPAKEEDSKTGPEPGRVHQINPVPGKGPEEEST